MTIQPDSRTDIRRTFVEVWRKQQANEPLSALEDIIIDIIRRHPEYQQLLEQSHKYLDKDWRPEGGETNPFLHMGLHIAIREQLSIDRPAGVKTAYAALLKKTGDPHAAEHLMLECLAETLWHGQRDGRLPDDQAYLTCLNSRVTG
ncbi:MAG TPA: DUF1841 family protein [Gammaproteobacteria bacterium]|nr:DUF1841 family protein [Gammaproteobacteria bacterium]